MTIKQQSGFGVVPIIVIIAAVAVLGFVGFRIFTAQSNKPAISNATTNSQTSTVSNQPSSTQASATPAQTDTYLHIKELGIKIKLGDGIKDAVYTASTSSDGGMYAHLSTKSLSTQSNGTCGTDAAPLGIITKASGTPEQVFGGTSRTVDNKSTFKFGSDTYIFLTGPQAMCSENSAAQTLADQQRSVFAEAFKTVQLDN